MPLNEILAPSYCKVFYDTPRHTGHSLRLYFQNPTVPTSVGATTFKTGGINPDTTLQWTIQEIVLEFFRRTIVGFATASPLTIVNVECWDSETGANEFIGFDTSDYSGLVSGSGTNIAAAYLGWNFQDASRNNWRFFVMDSGDARPQRYPQVIPPLVDNDTLNWFIIRSTVGFATNDGNPLVRATSVNTGYNRFLARKYGRVVTP